MTRKYFGTAGSQLHLHSRGDAGTPILCLPPAPHSGLYFARFQDRLAPQHSIAVDPPGYGGSDARDYKSIEDYARSLVPLLASYGKVHILGFHSGCLIALALARLCPEYLDHVILTDVPFFDGPTRKTYAAHFSKPLALPSTAEDLSSHFDAQVGARTEDLGHARAYALWVETLRAGEHRNNMFRAAFAYDVETTLRQMTHPVHMIATQSSLLEPTRAAAKLCRSTILSERLGIDKAVFDLFSAEMAELVKTHLRT